jgi:tetratricopeptide (TPR) repeat protein
MGTVYEARDRERRQRVAVKTLIDFDPAALYLFKQEFRTLAGVHHPNLVRLHELVATEGDRVFFTMELVRGVDFLAYVEKPRNAPAVEGASAVETGPPTAAARSCPADLDRLRPALRQLVEGIQALHLAGKLHRDIKPSNILVTPEGRVVLLDFGVATEVPRVADENLREEGHVVGTARYMAPEQAFEDAPTPAADWYSLGVILYEALAGGPPFSGPGFEVIRLKNETNPVPPSALVDGVPHDLDALCRALLDITPDKRPTGPEILRLLGVSRASVPPPPLLAQPAAGPSLVGRESQVRALLDAFDASRAGSSITVRIGGRAGMGKSALLQHFLDGIVEHGEGVVLRGKAYERESVPYKAVDSIVDALSRHLMHVADNEGTLILPMDMDALARLFPVLRRVPSIGQIAESPVVDPQRVRRRAFGALRELLATLAARRPLVVYIDDVQWGDTDSVALLLELIRPPFAPPVLFLLAHREEDAQSAAFLSEIRARWPAGAEARDLSVGPLSVDDARALALTLLGHRDESTLGVADAIARESGGSPFLVEELARSASSSRLLAANDAKVTLEQMVAERLAGLPEDARRLTEIVAIGGRPLPVSTVSDAAGIESSDDMVAMLCTRRFLRAGMRDGREVVEPVHDRIRETIVAQLPAALVREHHGSLARALEATPGADPEALALHLLGAGQTERAARFAERAAQQAVAQLAFDQAARLYRLTIDTLPQSSPASSGLRKRLGEVLGWAGRSEEAGRAYLAAADGLPAPERLALERAASEQLLAAGRIEEGGLVLRRVLSNAGIRAPVSPLSAVFWLILYKLRLKISRLRFVERTIDQVRPADRARVDALHVAARGLASVDTLLAACMQARQMVEVLRVGDRDQVLRAAIIYGIHLATLGGPLDTHERGLLEIIARLAQPGASPELIISSRATGGVALFLRGRWREALETIDKVYAKLPSHIGGAQKAQVSLYGVYALVFLGNLIELRRRYARMLADADERGDLFTSVQLRASHPSVLLLAADDPDAARRQTSEATAQWTDSKYLTQHWQVMRSEAEIELYSGNPSRAYERLEQDERELKKSRLLNVQFIRALTTFVRGRAAIASIDAVPAQRTARLAEARRLARRLARENMAWTAPLAAILNAALASTRRDDSGTVGALRAAVELAIAADMGLYAAAAQYQLGLSLGGEAGDQLVDQADRDMRAQDIRAPERFSAMLVPVRRGSTTASP